MNVSPYNIIPITDARARLSDLADRVKREDVVILTKGGKAKAALVDIEYLTKLQNEVKKIYKKTFIDPALLPYTREFTDAEIKEWEEEDKL